MLVAYMSSTGNTRKVAEAIYGEIAVEKEIKPIGDVDSLNAYDFAFLGFPTHGYGPDKKTREILEKLCKDKKKVALFVTHGAPEDEPEVAQYMVKFRNAASDADIVGCFDCQGEMSGGVRFAMLFMGKKAREERRKDNSQGQPDAARIKRAAEFARETMNRVTGKS